MYRSFTAIIALCFCAQLFAQTTVGFETNDIQTIEVFDMWEDSPFTTGQLEGNCMVISNFLKDDVNPSEKILAVQRSRFGSNTFGVKIDLLEPFDLTPTPKTVSVMLHRPYDGRVMVIGLGRRTDKPWQSKETVQFTRISKADIPADSWQNVSVSVKGAPGVVIYSLVIVPDCESPHDYTEDSICHIDNIVYQ